MQSIIPFSLTEIIQTELERERRSNDGLLHASSHLEGSLRHAQLDVAGAPKVPSDLVGQMALWIGSLIHEDIHRMLRKAGVFYSAEVNLTPWLPPGWGGTADAVIWNPELKAFVLLDMKTTKGEALRYILKDGAKVEHVAQTSAYWHALKKAGIPLAKAVAVYYLPKNPTRSKDDLIEPVMVDFTPLPAKQLNRTMAERAGRVSEYIESIPEKITSLDDLVTDALEPVQPRQQRVYFDRKTDTYELKLVPHWSTAFCPFPTALCNCREQGTTKLGFFDVDGTYYPRPEYEDVEPEVTP